MPAVVCPQCKLENPPGSERCGHCNTPLGTEGATITDASEAPRPSSGIAQLATSLVPLQPGGILNNRYEILDLLGEGGMGAVYKALDRELDRLLALKVIRPELARNPEILQRFKNELILARKITHKNVNRIFDLGESDGVKFISMEYVEGEDLKSIIRQRGKLSPEEAIPLIIQICRALNAAHSEGVVHRDLKPHNVMVDKQGTVQVMDFGLAASTEMTGFTQTGALLGTPEYMSPEQAKGEKADPRSDIFALGIIFYEMLTGETPYGAESAYSTLLKRTQERAAPVSKLDPTIPQHVSEVVSKCLQIDPRHRYQSAIEILEDLEARRRPRSVSIMAQIPIRFRTVTESRIWQVGAAVAAVVLILVLALLKPFFWSSRPPPTKVVSLAVLPFQNASGDQNLDWLGSGIADMLATDLGQLEGLRAVSPDRLHQILKDLRISSAAGVDSMVLNRVAEFSSADLLLWGKYLKLGEQIRIDASLYQVKEKQTVALKADAASEAELLEAVEQLVTSIHAHLSLPSSSRKALQAKALLPSTKSVQALRHYNEGMALARQGRQLEAVKKFEASIEADPKFALAHAQLAQTYDTLGYGWEAERFARQAVDLSEGLPEQQRYLILAHQARIVKDLDQAIEAYTRLVESMPSNTQFHYDLASLYEDKGDFTLALQHYAKVLERDPQDVKALYAAARVQNKRRNFQDSLDYLNRALSLAIQLDNQESKAEILSELGYAYQWLNKREEALRYYRESIDIQRQLKNKKGTAIALNRVALVYDLEGRPDEARASYEEALSIYKEIGEREGTATVLMNLGSFFSERGQHTTSLNLTKEALQLYMELGKEHEQASAYSNIGATYFDLGRYEEAITFYERALQLRQKLKLAGEIAETLYNLAEASARTGKYEQALTSYLQALEIWRNASDRLGVGYASFGMGILFKYQGRYGAALDAMDEAFKIFRELQERSLWGVEVQAGYGNALSLVGRGEEAQQNLKEAMAVARELANKPLIGRILVYQGDASFYQGDLKSARALYQEAQKTVAGTADRYVILLSRVSLAKVDVAEGRSKTAAEVLASLAREADTLGLKHLSAECSILRAEALLNAKNHPRARQELDAALRLSDNLGLRALQVRGHYLLARLHQVTGNKAGAARHYGEASRLLEEMSADAGNTLLQRRQDLAAIYAESSRSSTSPPS